MGKLLSGEQKEVSVFEGRGKAVGNPLNNLILILGKKQVVQKYYLCLLLD